MNFDSTTLRDLVVVLVPMILSLSVHEFAHAWSAHKLGDDTASSQGRMTLNPIAHIDLFGTLLIPIFSVLHGGISLIGWAKPVPVSPYRFNRNVSMHTGMILTAFAGPASNLILAFAAGGAAMIAYSQQIEMLAPHLQGGRMDALLMLGSPSFVDGNIKVLSAIGISGFNPALMLLGRIFAMNVGLAVFNMIPVPPLDGSRVLPLGLQEKLLRYSLVVFIGFIILINMAGRVLWVPVSAVGNGMLWMWGLFF